MTQSFQTAMLRVPLSFLKRFIFYCQHRGEGRSPLVAIQLESTIPSCKKGPSSLSSHLKIGYEP